MIPPRAPVVDGVAWFAHCGLVKAEVAAVAVEGVLPLLLPEGRLYLVWPGAGGRRVLPHACARAGAARARLS